MASNNTTLNPTYQGRITHPSNGVVAKVGMFKPWEARSAVITKAKKFGYDLNTAQVYKWDDEAGDYILHEEETAKIFEPTAGKPGVKKAPLRAPATEDQLDAMNTGYSIWEATARIAKRYELNQEEITILLQSTLETFVQIGISPKDITTTLRQVVESAKAQESQQ